jgi:hypothetical protein
MTFRHGRVGWPKTSVIYLIDPNDPQPPDCPEFDYEHHPDWQTILPLRVAETVADLARGRIDTRAAALDTRGVHLRLFVELAPAGHEYFAGHYRGEPFRCLRHYIVGIQTDPRVGVTPSSVASWIADINAILQSGIDALDADPALPRADRLRYLIVLACRVFELYLRVHPYANGNGHAARFLVWCLLGRYGHWPRRWPIEPRPPDPPYTECIVRYRNGDRDPLEQFLASTLLP